MLSLAVDIGLLATVVAMLLNVWRLARGPDLEDRVLALDTLYINSIAVVLLLSLGFDTRMYFEAALLIAMMGFVGTIAFGKYLLRKRLMD